MSSKERTFGCSSCWVLERDPWGVLLGQEPTISLCPDWFPRLATCSRPGQRDLLHTAQQQTMQSQERAGMTCRERALLSLALRSACTGKGIHVEKVACGKAERETGLVLVWWLWVLAVRNMEGLSLRCCWV